VHALKVAGFAVYRPYVYKGKGQIVVVTVFRVSIFQDFTNLLHAAFWNPSLAAESSPKPLRHEVHHFVFFFEPTLQVLFQQWKYLDRLGHIDFMTAACFSMPQQTPIRKNSFSACI